MTHSTKRTVLVRFDDGPRSGEELMIEPDPSGGAPERLVVSDPLASDIDRSAASGPRAATTYHLRGREPCAGAFVYLTGVPD